MEAGAQRSAIGNGAPNQKEVTMKLNTIVVGFDGSPTALDALNAAVELVSDEGTVHVVCAFRLPSAGEAAEVLAELPDEFQETYNPLERPEADMQRATSYLKERGVRYEEHLVKDHPAAAIIDVADEVDAELIIVGSRGMSRSTRFLRGSVSPRVASHATRSFMVVHDKA